MIRTLRRVTFNCLGTWLCLGGLFNPFADVNAQPEMTEVTPTQCITQSAASDVTSDARNQFQIGAQRDYHLSYTSDSQYDFGVLLQAQAAATSPNQSPLNLSAQSVRLTLTTDIEITVLAYTANHYQLMYRFINPEVRIMVSDQADDAVSERVRSELLSPVYIEARPSGRIDGISIRPGANAITHGLLRAVLSLSQFITPENGNYARTWTTTEDDPNGSFTVTYLPLSRQKLQELVQNRFRKQRISHAVVETESTSGTVMLQKQVQPSGSIEALFDVKQGILHYLKGTDKQVISINKHKVGATQNTLQFNLIKSDCLNKQANAQLMLVQQQEPNWKAKRAPLYTEATTVAEREAVIARSTLGQDTVESLSAMLTQLSTDTNNEINQTDLYLKLKSMMLLKPDSCAVLTEQIVKLSPANPAYKLLVGALQAVGNEQAQTGLMRLLTLAKDDVPVTLYLLQAMATVHNPMPMSVDRFLEFANSTDKPDIARTAQLGLGVMTRKLASTDAIRSDSLVKMFIQRLQTSTDDDDRRQWLLVLGNAGTPAAYVAVNQYLSAPSPRLRATAISALRWQRNPAVTDQLLNAMQQDVDDEVRIAAAQTLAFRPRTEREFAVFKSSLTKDTSPKLRKALLVILWQNRSDYPEATKLVQHAANQDKDESVRETAKKLLGVPSTKEDTH